MNNFVIGYGFGPAIAMKDETRDNGRDRLFFRKVSQLQKSTKARVKKYGGFDIPNSDRSYEFLNSRISHFVRNLTGNSTYEKALRMVSGSDLSMYVNFNPAVLRRKFSKIW